MINSLEQESLRLVHHAARFRGRENKCHVITADSSGESNLEIFVGRFVDRTISVSR
jgi:hypothetical protein